MARKQNDYLAELLADETEDNAAAAPSPDAALSSRAGLSLLGRESALARVASGEVRQVTQMRLDPARVRVWRGNARIYDALTEANTRELIDAILSEGGQKMPAIVRRVEGDPDHDYEVIAGTRRHFAISWLRANAYPQFTLLVQVEALDDEAAFRLADIENRARKDVCDLERARNYAAACKAYYGGHQARMAERLRLSTGWLSKMFRVAALPDAVVAAFASPADIQLKPAYPLAQALDDPAQNGAILAEARQIADEQARARTAGAPPLPSALVIQRLLAAPFAHGAETASRYEAHSRYGRALLTVQSVNRQGVTFKLHSGSGADLEEAIAAVRAALIELERQGRGLHR